MPKKIRLWKMVLLLVVTFGVYSLIWLFQRRNEIVTKFKLPLPHWSWLPLPYLVSLLLILPVAWLTYGMTSSVATTTIVTYIVCYTGLLISMGISIWWMFKFSVAVSKITDGKVPTLWGMIWTIFVSPFNVLAFQYYFNRLPKSVTIKTKPKYAASKNFITVTAVAVAIALPVNYFNLAGVPSQLQEILNDQKKTQSFDRIYKETEKLAEDYNRCIKQLDHDFPGDITEEIEAAYNAAYQNCDNIRAKQHQKADEYTESVKNW